MIPAFHEEWFCDQSQAMLASLVESVPDGMLVEIGSWEGRSTVALANAARPRIVHCVDTWEGSPAEISADLAARRDVHAQWQANVDYLTQGNVEAHRCGWRDWTPPEPVAFVFIDAEHTRSEVRDNIAFYLPRMVSGGVICGDDAGHPPVADGVADVLPMDDVYVNATVWFWRVP